MEAPSLRLPDGRKLAWAEFGDPVGAPVLYCHGWPGSRLEAAHAHDCAGGLGLRLIAPDRPGIGLSDFQPGRTLAGYAADMAALADALGIARFSVLGVSGGAPYAIACAALLPQRVRRLALVCGLGPLDDTASHAELSPLARLAFGLARRWPAGLRGWGALVAGLLRRHPQAMLALLRRRLPAPDRHVLADPQFAARQLASWREAFRAGVRGAARDGELYVRPWGLTPAAVVAPTRLWHGGADGTVPVTMGRRLAAAIPGCQAEFPDHEGHFSLPLHRGKDVLGFLRGAD